MIEEYRAIRSTAYEFVYFTLPLHRLSPFGGYSEMLLGDRKFHPIPIAEFGAPVAEDPFEFRQELCLRKLEPVVLCMSYA